VEKAQTMLSLDPSVRDRCDALRVVMKVSRGEVIRQALERGGLHALERGQVPRLARLYALASAAGMPWEQYVRELVRGRQVLPTLEELERRAERKKTAKRSKRTTTHTPDEQAAEIRTRRAEGESLRSLAARYGISHEKVRQLCADPSSGLQAETSSTAVAPALFSG
jgi:transcriptional regulator with XRE-family HTH domain